MNRELYLKHLLVYLAIKYKGDSKRTIEFLEKNEKVDEEELERVVSQIDAPYITIMDSDYPTVLKEIKFPPFVLFLIGDKEIFNGDDEIKIEVKNIDFNSRIYAFFVNNKYSLLGFENHDEPQRQLLPALWFYNNVCEYTPQKVKA